MRSSYARPGRYGASGNRFKPVGGLSRALSAYPGLPDYTSRINPYDTSFGSAPGGTGTPGTDLPGPNVQQPVAQPLPGPTPSSPPAGGGGAGAGGQAGQRPPNPYGLSYEGDPVLQRIRAFNTANVENAHAAELSKRKQAAIGFGHAKDTPVDLSLYGDEATAQAAEQNPFSILAQLLQGHSRRVEGLDTGLNDRNLYYSSTRGRVLGDEGQQYLGEQASANNQLAALLGGYNQEVLGAEQGAAQSNMDAETGAYQRALDFALQYGIGPGGVAAESGTTSGNAPAGMRLRVNDGGSVNASDQSMLDTSGGWGVRWEGPGVYEAWKGNPDATGHSDTMWVKVADAPGAGAPPPASTGQVVPPPPGVAPAPSGGTLADLLKKPRYGAV